MFPRSFQARPAAALGSVEAAFSCFPCTWACLAPGKGILSWGWSETPGENPQSGRWSARNFCSTLTAPSQKELCASEFCDLKTPFPAWHILGNEILWFSLQSGQWITSDRSAQNRDPGHPGKWLAFLSRCLHIFWICGIHLWEATNWSIRGDLSDGGVLGVEGISQAWFL